MTSILSGKVSHTFNRNRSRNEMSQNQNFNIEKVNNQCRCFVQKMSKLVQTDDIKFVVLPAENCINDMDDNNNNNNSNCDTSSNYQTCSSSTTSEDAASLPTSPNYKSKILPKSICKNRKSVDMSNDNKQSIETVNNTDEKYQMNKKGGKSPIFIPAGHIYKFETKKNKQKNSEKKHENIDIEGARITKETNHQIIEQNRTENDCKCPNFCDKWNDCINWKNHNLQFPNIDGNHLDEPKKSLFLHESIRSNITITRQIIKENSLIYGQHIPKPSDLSIINKEIRDVINTNEINEITNYCWTIIRRHLNLFIIGEKQVGKYFNYLPSICSFSLETVLYNDFSQFNSNGPIIIILTPYKETSKKIYEEIQSLFRDTWSSPKVQLVTENTKAIKACDILIIDASKLLEFLQKSKLCLKRLCHLIIENLDIQICTQPDLLGNFLKIINEMLLKRPVKTTFQLIATSDTWMRNFEIFLKQLDTLPIIIFNDCPLDVAIYSNLNLIRKILKPNHLKFYLSDILRGHFQTKRTIIFCKDQEEICDIGDCLEHRGIVNFKILEDTNDEEIHNYERLFLKSTSGSYKVLICSDNSYKKMENIKNCDWLIHCGFSNNWNTFIDRFKCMLEKFTSPLSEEDRCMCCFAISEDDKIAEEMYNNFMAMYSKRVIEKLKL